MGKPSTLDKTVTNEHCTAFITSSTSSFICLIILITELMPPPALMLLIFFARTCVSAGEMFTVTHRHHRFVSAATCKDVRIEGSEQGRTPVVNADWALAFVRDL